MKILKPLTLVALVSAVLWSPLAKAATTLAIQYGIPTQYKTELFLDFYPKSETRLNDDVYRICFDLACASGPLTSGIVQVAYPIAYSAARKNCPSCGGGPKYWGYVNVQDPSFLFSVSAPMSPAEYPQFADVVKSIERCINGINLRVYRGMYVNTQTLEVQCGPAYSYFGH